MTWSAVMKRGSLETFAKQANNVAAAALAVTLLGEKSKAVFEWKSMERLHFAEYTAFVRKQMIN